MKKISCLLITILISFNALAEDENLLRAVTLYQNGLYAQAMDVLQSMPQYGENASIDGYFVLCAQKQHSRGYEELALDYLQRYSASSLCKDIRKELSMDYFDRGMYRQSLDYFETLRPKDYKSNQRAEYSFKKGYSKYMLKDNDGALADFADVIAYQANDYTSPANYLTGYINYGKGGFKTALEYFSKASRDERMAPLSNYYTVTCFYELKDYDKVIEKGVALYEDESTTEERKAYLARLISESYLVKGNRAKAREFYNDTDDSRQKSRADWFFAGSLMFATGDYQAAIENYGNMPEKSDSLGQIAWYQTALSYLKVKNKVAALGSFRNAALLDYDAKIKEDAFFNYAKLAFDLNGDTSVFKEYVETWSDKVRGEQIFSYMALAALADKDYQRAIDAYDKIDMLDGQNQNNYVHANYLRGAELMASGSYKKAAQCMQVVTFYTEKTSPINQLARYYLAETYYRDGKFSQAGKEYTDLYNNSALYGMPQSELLTYNLAWTYFKQADYDNAYRWFSNYADNGGKTYVKDALLRRADSRFAQAKYSDAAREYKLVMDRFFDKNDVYTYYQAALSTGLAATTSKARSAAVKTKAELLSNVLEADPSVPYYAEAVLELGRTQLAAGKSKDAEKSFILLTENRPLTPFAAQAFLELGTLRRNAGNVEGALSAYKEVVEKMEASGYADDALLALESIYQSRNQPKEYFAYLESIGRGESKTEEQKEDMVFSAAQQLYYADSYAKALDAFREFQHTYPNSSKAVDSWYYLGECYRMLGDKERASEAYAVVNQRHTNLSDAALYENSLMQYAQINYSMEEYAQALEAYAVLAPVASLEKRAFAAYQGAMRSAYKAHSYDRAIEFSAKVASLATSDKAAMDEADMTLAKSYLATSERDNAFEVLERLAKDPSGPEGAEAALMIIQDAYDSGDFDAVKDKVYALSDSGTKQQLYLAKAFIVLGDAFAEQGNLKQAKATFQSIADGFKDDADINAELQMRLNKLEEIK